MFDIIQLLGAKLEQTESKAEAIQFDGDMLENLILFPNRLLG